MRLCPACGEVFEDDLSYCMFDGTALQASDRDVVALPDDASDAAIYESGWSREAPRSSRRRAVIFLLFVIVSIGGAATVYLSSGSEKPPAVDNKPAPAAVKTVEARETKAPEATSAPEETALPVSLAHITRAQLMEFLPQTHLRRFNAGKPADLRIVRGEKEEYVVMAGAGNSGGSSRGPAGRILAFQYEGGQFIEATGRILPSAYASGIVSGRRAEVRFDDANVNILVREPASSRAIVDECSACDHAYQTVTLAWKDSLYIERERAWENEPYSIFYAVADALAKQKVDARARPIIDRSLDHKIAGGFARKGNKGWSVIWRRNEADTGEFELGNESGYLVITVSRVNGQWKAIAISGN